MMCRDGADDDSKQCAAMAQARRGRVCREGAKETTCAVMAQTTTNDDRCAATALSHLSLSLSLFLPSLSNFRRIILRHSRFQ